MIHEKDGTTYHVAWSSSAGCSVVALSEDSILVLVVRAPGGGVFSLCWLRDAAVDAIRPHVLAGDLDRGRALATLLAGQVWQ